MNISESNNIESDKIELNNMQKIQSITDSEILQKELNSFKDEYNSIFNKTYNEFIIQEQEKLRQKEEEKKAKEEARKAEIERVKNLVKPSIVY